jgi:hypothetical protein
MRKIILFSIVLFLFLLSVDNLVAQKGSHSHSYKSTYELGGTKYKYNESYKTTGLPKVERSRSAKNEFLENQGYKRTPLGYEVDHIIPLSKGGVDKPYNMQLLPKEVHKQKTANERKQK